MVLAEMVNMNYCLLMQKNKVLVYFYSFFFFFKLKDHKQIKID